MYVCVRACAGADARARACVCGKLGAEEYACACERVALLIQHATRMRHIVLSFVASMAPPCSTSYTARFSWGKKI